jgi:hypothetical protein
MFVLLGRCGLTPKYLKKKKEFIGKKTKKEETMHKKAPL